MTDVVAPLTGIIVRVVTGPGTEVGAEDCVAVLESMKMEIQIQAGAPGVIEDVWVEAGQLVDAGDTIARVSPGT